VCKPRCSEDNECQQPEEYCDDEDDVCRRVSDLPCTEAAYYVPGARNNAPARAPTLELPPRGSSRFETDLSVCNDDEDWFALPLQASDRIKISLSTVSNLRADFDLINIDGAAVLDGGYIGGFSNSNVEFTANVAGTYYLRVMPAGDTSGFYSILLDLSEGVACVDEIENNHGTNNTLDTAGWLLNYTDLAQTPSECGMEQEGQTTDVLCGIDALTFCLGDIDYYKILVPAASDLTIDLDQVTGGLKMTLFGPFPELADFDEMVIADSSSSYLDIKQVTYFSRDQSFYVLRIERGYGAETAYSLDVSLTQLESCVEDAFDDATAAVPSSLPTTTNPLPVQILDPAGINDSATDASFLALVANATVAWTGTLCVGDDDWFRLGVVGNDGAITNLPLGYRVKLDLEVAAEDFAMGALTMAVGEIAGDTPPTSQMQLMLGSYDTRAPAQSVFLSSTGAPTWVWIGDGQDVDGHVNYTVRATVTAPPECTPDADNTPSLATVVPTPQVETPTMLDHNPALCGADIDWYIIDLPEDTELVATAHFDPTTTNVGVALFAAGGIAADSVDVPPPLATALDSSAATGAGVQQVRGGAGVGTLLAVYNRGDWPLEEYELEFNLISMICEIDPFEDNDDPQNAAAIILYPQDDDPRMTVGYATPLSVCESQDDDWFKLRLGNGDKVEVFINYRPEDIDLDAFLRLPLSTLTGGSTTPQSVDSDFDDQNRTGVLKLERTIPADAAAGEYFIQVRSFRRIGTANSTTNHYSIEARVHRGCLDDPFEPFPPARTSLFTWQPQQTISNLALCQDDDWFEVVVPAGVCFETRIEFDYNEGDLDLALHRDSPEGERLEIAAIKNPMYQRTIETIERRTPSDTDETILIHVMQDSALITNILYTLELAEINCP